MVDISVKDLVKFFVIGENLLDGLSFEIQEGECVAILGRNGCGKTTLFKIITGEMEYDEGEVYVNPNKRMGMISQIPVFPEGYSVEDVLRSAYSGLLKIKKDMERLEREMVSGATADQLRSYDSLSNRFQSGGGYDMDVEVDKICNGLGITAQQREQEFASLSGGELKRIEIATVLARATALSVFDEPEAGIDLWSFQNLIQVFERMQEKNKEQGSIIIISHQERILNIADEIVVLRAGEIIKHGPKEEVLPTLLGTSSAVDMCAKFEGGAK